jgi:hypothetical protein
MNLSKSESAGISLRIYFIGSDWKPGTTCSSSDEVSREANIAQELETESNCFCYVKPIGFRIWRRGIDVVPA